MQTIDRKQLALVILRVTLAVLIGIHGWHRFIEGDVNDMGHGFETRGYPLGMVLAYTITGLEMFGALVYACGRLLSTTCRTAGSLQAPMRTAANMQCC